MTSITETGAAVLLFAATFLVAGRVHPPRWLNWDERSIVSLGAGMSSAYVFVHVMPELHAVRRAFAGTVSVELRFQGMAVYFLALVGFLVFYGLDHLRARFRKGAREKQADAAFKLHIGGFAAYAGLMAYLTVNSLEETTVSTAAFAVAIAFHFLAVTHSLREEHRSAYDDIGRFVLAGAVLFGWVLGLVFPFPQYVVALLMAFVSGAIIMNSTIMELPPEKDGRFLPFLVGGLLYGLILLPLG